MGNSIRNKLNSSSESFEFFLRKFLIKARNNLTKEEIDYYDQNRNLLTEFYLICSTLIDVCKCECLKIGDIDKFKFPEYFSFICKYIVMYNAIFYDEW